MKLVPKALLALSIAIGATAHATNPVQFPLVSRAAEKEDEGTPSIIFGSDIGEDAEPEPPPNQSTNTPNPFQEGCLRSNLGKFYDKRVCNSDDAADAAEQGLCDKPPFDYLEIRISNSVWGAPMTSAWIMQMMLSELLRVPSTIETSSRDQYYNFYDEQGRADFAAEMYPYDALEVAHEVGDCRKLKESNAKGGYKSCAHVFPTVNAVGQANDLRKLQDEGIISQPRLDANHDQYRWYMPKFYAEKHLSLLTHYGLSGNSTRPKLAELFKRPTNWATYCRDVSPNACEGYDGVAVRKPHNDSAEGGKYFLDGLYDGYFRATEKNNCTANPGTCTGHITNVPCSWACFVIPQAYHLDISVESDGYLPNGGYNYSSLVEIYDAANATRSNVLMSWWEPDLLIERYRGTDYEFVPITLPSVTNECVNNRVSEVDRCSGSFLEQIGSAKGACDAGSEPLVIPMTLEGCDQSEGDCSPAYAALTHYEITNLDLQQIFSDTQDPNRDARNATCKWFAENLDRFNRTVTPKTYPRHRRNVEFYTPLTYFSIALSVLSMTSVLICAGACKVYEKTKVMINAQVDFLLIILSGMFLVAVSSLLFSIAPTKAVCVSRNWFMTVGYSLELVPLAVKVAAINRIVLQSQKCKRVGITKSLLYKIVGGCIMVICIYLTIWTAVDTTIPRMKMTLTDEPGNVVVVSTFCASSNQGWDLASRAYFLLLIIGTAVAATQNRGIREEYDETRYLTLMIYSHVMFAIMRLVIRLVRSNFSQTVAVSDAFSILLSLDVLCTICIYFMPKINRANKAVTENPDLLDSWIPDPKKFLWALINDEEDGKDGDRNTGDVQSS